MHFIPLLPNNVQACTCTSYTFGSSVIICMFAKNYGKSEQSPYTTRSLWEEMETAVKGK